MAGTGKQRFIPLGARHNGEAAKPIVLFEDAPAHLFNPLAEWCAGAFWQDSWWKGRTRTKAIAEMCLDLQLKRSEFSFGNEVEDLCKSHPDRLMDIVDWILHPQNRHGAAAEGAPGAFATACTDLEEILFRGGSAWQVADPPNQVIRRLPEELVTEFEDATSHNDPVSEHLWDAWNAAWRHGDPSAVEAYDGAVKAIEAVLVPIVIPNDPSATLGKVLSALRAKPEKWDTRFRGEETVAALAAMLNELWRTQVRHHKSEYLENTLEEAQDAVTIAVAVVGLCRRGFLERVEDYTPEEEAEDLAIAEAALERYQSGNMKTVPYEEVVGDWVANESST